MLLQLLRPHSWSSFMDMKVVWVMQADLTGQESWEEGRKVWGCVGKESQCPEKAWGHKLGDRTVRSLLPGAPHHDWHGAVARSPGSTCVYKHIVLAHRWEFSAELEAGKKLARFSDPLRMIAFWFSHRFWWRSLQGGVVSKTAERRSKRQGSPWGCVLHSEALMKHKWSFLKRKIWFIQWYWSGICWYLISCRLGIASEGAAATAFFQIWFWGLFWGSFPHGKEDWDEREFDQRT